MWFVLVNKVIKVYGKTPLKVKIQNTCGGIHFGEFSQSMLSSQDVKRQNFGSADKGQKNELTDEAYIVSEAVQRQKTIIRYGFCRL